MQSKNSDALPPPLFYFKVNLNCCTTCQNKAKKGLQKLDGVVAVNIEEKSGLVAISGHLEPEVVVKKFAKWGKMAVIWSPKKDTFNTETKSNQTSNFQHAKKGKDSCCNEKDSSSDSESDCDHKKPSKISWQHPDIANKTAPVAATKQTKKHFSLLGLCCGKNSATHVEVAEPRPSGISPSFRSNVMGHTSTGGTWLPPRGPIRPYFPPHYGNQMSMPMAYGSYPYHQPMHLPPPPPGCYPPKHLPHFNPMVHFTRYEDNYSYW